MNDMQTDSPLELIECKLSAVLDGLREIKVCPAGEVKSKSGTFVLDADAAGLIVAEFENHETELPVDYGHQTLGGEYSAPDGIARAAGWLSKLWFSEEGGGLRALVRWTDKAREMIRADELRYLSPVATYLSPRTRTM